jgi:N6-L-threonylcarbamoyladenine synthase
MSAAKPRTDIPGGSGPTGRLILAIETSCDDTCAAVVDGATIRSNVISSQAAAHARYGGVVPEVASRHHVELINPVVDAALAEAGVELGDVDSLAVTRGPGMVGALLVGIASAKALAASGRKPLAGIDHLHGHVAANFLDPRPLQPPFLCLIASGGHTLLAGVAAHDSFEVLGQTLDDAAGEALDKGARLLGLGYPGGPAIERAAADGEPDAFEFPVAMANEPGLDFSFSGIKTALLYTVRELGDAETERRRADLAASYQAAVIGQLISKLRRAARGGTKRRRLAGGGWRAVALGGGVAANSMLRREVESLCEAEGLELKLVPHELCTDNAAMIAAAARYVDAAPYPEYLGWDAAA